MGDKRLYFDEYEKKQYYLDENGDPVYLEPEPSDKKPDSSVKVAVIGGVFAVIVAIISIIPLFPRETPSGETEYVPGICIISNSQFVNSVFNCGSQTSIEIAVAATLTAVAPTPMPTEIVPTITLSAMPTSTHTATVISTLTEIPMVTATPQTQPTQIPAMMTVTAISTVAQLCNSDAMFATLDFDNLGERTNAGSGVFANAVRVSPYLQPSARISYSDFAEQHPCIQSMGPGTFSYDRGCLVSQYNTNLIWFGSSYAGTSIKIEETNIGTQNTPPSLPVVYVIEHDVRAGDTICVIPPEGLNIETLADEKAYGLRIGPDVLNYIQRWCDIVEDDGTERWCG